MLQPTSRSRRSSSSDEEHLSKTEDAQTEACKVPKTWNVKPTRPSADYVAAKP
jgi:hypothetical protein